MLQFNQSQMNKLKEAQRDHFLEKAAGIFKKFWPQKCSHLDEQELELLLNKLIDQAKSYDITGQKQVLRYMNLAFLLGQEFHKEKWAIPIFHSSLDQAAKIDQAYQYVENQS